MIVSLNSALIIFAKVVKNVHISPLSRQKTAQVLIIMCKKRFLHQKVRFCFVFWNYSLKFAVYIESNKT